MTEYHTIPFYIGHEDPKRHGTVEEEFLHHSEDLGYDILTTRITNDNFQPRVLSHLSKHLRDLETSFDTSEGIPSPQHLVLPPLNADDTTLSPSEISPRLLHVASTWIDLASSDDVISEISRQVLDLEVSYAAFCGASNILIRGPSPKSGHAGLTQYARAIKHAMKSAPLANFQIVLPMTYETDWDASVDLGDLSRLAREQSAQEKTAMEGVRADSFGSWDTWDLIRSMCNYDTRLSLALVIPRHLPSVANQTRWLSEPLRILKLSRNTFTPNKFATPVLSQGHRALVSRCLRLKTTPWLLLSDIGPLPEMEPLDSMPAMNGTSLTNDNLMNGTPPHQGSLSPLSMHPTPAESAQHHFNYTSYPVHPSQHPTAHLQYLRTQIPRQPPLSPIELYGAGYQDFPQSPLQPLTDNLESVTYEVFEKDPVKYAQYEAALAAALRDWSRNGKARSAPESRILVAVVGAGRGPLVERALRASQTTNVPIDVWAIEKNPSAYVHLQRRNAAEWSSQVHLVQSDMRSWRGPCYLSPQSTAGADGNDVNASQPSFAATFSSSDTHAAIDIVVSELLGSFADNELSPECLDGVTHLLIPGHSISIPSSYSAHITPIAAPRLWTDIKSRSATTSGADATSIPYVAWLHAIDYLSTSSPTKNTPPSINPTPAPSNSLLSLSPEPIVKETWSFSHPLPPSHILSSNTHNTRFSHTTFATPNRGVCHGIAGYFECVLYAPSLSPSSGATNTSPHPFSYAQQASQNPSTTTESPQPPQKKKPIELSTHPLTMSHKSADMISWFPIFFPLKTPLMFVYDGEVGVSMWRMTDGRRVWYEWCVDVWGALEGEGKGRRGRVGTTGVVSSEGEGCLM